MISDEKWEKERDNLCRRAGLEDRMDADICLDVLGASVRSQLNSLNQGIKDKTNEDVYPHHKSGWRYDLPPPDFSTEKFIPNLLGNSEGYITLLNVLREIDSYSGFSDSFANTRISGGKNQPNEIQVFGALYSLGTNLGHNETVKMANGLISLKQLRDTENSFFSIKSLKNVNKNIIEFHCRPVNLSTMELQPLGKAITRMDAGVEPTWTYSRRALNNGWKSMSTRWLR